MRESRASSSGPILVLFARSPRRGLTKTRLAESLGEERALALYVAFVRDSIEIMRRASSQGIRPAIAWSDPSEAASDEEAIIESRGAARPPRESAESADVPVQLPGEAVNIENGGAARQPRERSEATPPPAPDGVPLAHDLAGIETLRQEGDDLGQRMSNCFAQLLARGHDRVVIIGADTPSLPVEYVTRAFEFLRDRDLVIGPSTDGGYYLIGVRAVFPEIFRGIPWGSDRVLAETLTILKIFGLPRVLLPEWSDVDTAEDLERLRDSLAGAKADDPTARNTRALLLAG